MKTKFYSIQGVFFQLKTGFGLGYMPNIGTAVTIEKIMTQTVFYGAIGPITDSYSLGGIMQDTYGKSILSDVFIDENHIEFTKKYVNRNDEIIYKFRKDIHDNWTGRYEGTAVGKGLANCILTPLKETFFNMPENLNGQPFIGEIVDWAQQYQRHLSGPNPEVSFSPKSGVSHRKCSNCFYRYYSKSKDDDCHCGEKGDLAKIAFGIPSIDFMPEQIAGKEVGHYCPYWCDPDAE